MGFSDYLKNATPAIAMGSAFGLFGGDDDESRLEGIKTPEWWEDPTYASSQKFLQTYGENILNGDIPDYYKSIGETGGADFENYLNLTNRDIMKATNESLARSGRGRGGAAGAVSAQTIADNSTKARYADYLRAQEGKKGLLSTGIGIEEGVRGAGFNNQTQRNNFNLGIYDREINKAGYLDAYDRQSSEDLGKTIGAVAPYAGAALGFAFGGPAGAQAGYGIGSALGGGMGGGSGSSSPQWLDILASSKNSGINGPVNSGSTAGVSSIGAIGDNSQAGFDDMLKKIFGGNGYVN